MYFIFFFIVPATPEIYTLSLHDALPILQVIDRMCGREPRDDWNAFLEELVVQRMRRWRAPERKLFRDVFTEDRKSTRLNSSHRCISYAVFCLKKKKKE